MNQDLSDIDDASDGFSDPQVIQAIADYQSAMEMGIAPSIDEWVGRFPGAEEKIAGCLRAMKFVDRAKRNFGVIGSNVQHGIGSIVGDYRILSIVGHGGMGQVYEAEQLSLGRRVALKILPASLTLDRQARERFQHEAKVAALLNHKCIVPIFAVGEDRGIHFIAMQKIAGISLSQWLHEIRSRKTDQPCFVRSETLNDVPISTDANLVSHPSRKMESSIQNPIGRQPSSHVLVRANTFGSSQDLSSRPRKHSTTRMKSVLFIAISSREISSSIAKENFGLLTSAWQSYRKQFDWNGQHDGYFAVYEP